MSAEVINELRNVIDELDKGISQVHMEFGDDAYRMKYRDGTYILLNSLSAKAVALAAIAQLEKTS